MDPRAFTKYGFQGLLLAALVYVVKLVIVDVAQHVEKLREDISFQSGIIDESCQPVKPRHKGGEGG